MPFMLDAPFAPHSTVRIGLIGCGGRGRSVLGEFLTQEGAECRALYDVDPERSVKAQELAPGAEVAGSWEALCDRNDLDFVIVASPWEWHVPMAVRAMEAGKHVGVEVPAAIDLEGCWQLVETSEKTERHCSILENCCYGRNELMALNMVRAGLFGTLVHAEAAYIHNLRHELFDPNGEGAWRRGPHLARNANLYPTHGLGPVCWYLGIHRGDRLKTMVSLSSLEAGLSEHRDTLANDDPRRSERYVCGDISTSILRTALGRTILLQHDVVSPRPYTRLNSVFGTRGAFADFPPRIFIDGDTEGHDWAPVDDYRERFEHPLILAAGEGGGHGGMDRVMAHCIVKEMREGLIPSLNVYDAAAWSAPTPLSEASVKNGGASQPYPDFTHGRWQNPANQPAMV